MLKAYFGSAIHCKNKKCKKSYDPKP
jgi:hypothetical protein